MKYVCEDCGKEVTLKENKWTQWIRCKCGGQMFPENYKPNGNRTTWRIT